MMNEQCNTQGDTCKRMSWSAVFAGALVGIGLSFLLNLLSVAIGLSIISTTNEGVATVAIGGLVGLLIGTIIAAFMGGLTAGTLGRPYCGTRNRGTLYGFLAWCIALILTAILATNIGRYVNSYSNFVANPSMVVVVEKPAIMRDVSTKEAVKEVKENKSANATMTTSGQQAASGMAIGSWLVFMLFFVGALFSAFGGHCAMHCCKKYCSTTR